MSTTGGADLLEQLWSGAHPTLVLAGGPSAPGGAVIEPTPIPAREALQYRLAQALDVPPEILGLGLAPVIDGEPSPDHVATDRLFLTCRHLIDDGGRRCILPIGHRHTCLPVPPDRGIAVR